jgi:molybdopterin molybdotransferase
MRPFSDLAPFAQVRRALEQIAPRLAGTERLALLEAGGRILAAPVVARVDVPNADRAAMDGYAARADDTQPDARLRLCGRVAAGGDSSVQVEAGECVEVATGSPLPPGADCVLPFEDVTATEAEIRVSSVFAQGQHVSRRADDLSEGTELGAVGARLHPSLVAACAAGGVQHVEVWRRPRVLVVPSGDEVVALGAGPLRPGQVFDSNAAALATLFSSCGCDVKRTPIIRDDRGRLAEALQTDGADVVVTIGGTSVGRRDLVSDVASDLGEIILHGVAVRPGKPLLLATLDGRPLVGLPGFPTSCLMMAYVTALPLVLRMGRLRSPLRRRSAVVHTDIASPAGKTHFLPVRLDGDVAVPTFTFSSAVTSMAAADGWIEIDEDTELVPAGSSTGVVLY